MVKIPLQSRKASAGLHDGTAIQQIRRDREKPYRTERQLVATPARKLFASAVFRDGEPDPPPGYFFVPFGTLTLSRVCMEIAKAKRITSYYVAEVKTVHISDLARYSHHVGYYLSRRIVKEACKLFGYVSFQGKLIKATDLHSEQEKIHFTKQAQKSVAKTSGTSSAQAAVQQTTENWQEVSDMFKEVYPNMPEPSIREIASHAWERDRIGFAAELPLHIRVQLATVAHIRHTYTDYDNLLAAFNDRNEARRTVEQAIVDVLIKWGPSLERGGKEWTQTYHDIVILDDENFPSEKITGTIDNTIEISDDENDGNDARSPQGSGDISSIDGSDSNPIMISDDDHIATHNAYDHVPNVLHQSSSHIMDHRDLPGSRFETDAVRHNAVVNGPSEAHPKHRGPLQGSSHKDQSLPNLEDSSQLPFRYLEPHRVSSRSLPNEHQSHIYGHIRPTIESAQAAEAPQEQFFQSSAPANNIYSMNGASRTGLPAYLPDLAPPPNTFGPPSNQNRDSIRAVEWHDQARTRHDPTTLGQSPLSSRFSQPRYHAEHIPYAHGQSSTQWPAQAGPVLSDRQPVIRAHPTGVSTLVHGAPAPVQFVTLHTTQPRGDHNARVTHVPNADLYTRPEHPRDLITGPWYPVSGAPAPVQFYRPPH